MNINLVDLVSFCNKLEQLSSVDLKDTVETELKKIIFTINSQIFFNTSVTSGLEDDYTSIKNEFNNFETSLNRIKNEVYSLISSLEQPWLESSYHLYKTVQYNKEQYGFYEDTEDSHTNEFGIVVRGPSPGKINYKNSMLEQIQTRQLEITDETRELFKSRVNNFADWHYPGMLIGANNEMFMEFMVATDPLYLVDELEELVTPIIAQFNARYQQRLRKYIIDEAHDAMFEKLPNNSIGLCVAYNHFEYRPIEIIKQYIQEIYSKLCLGGTLAMTFNDCDRYSAVMLAERQYACYTPGRLLYDFIKEVGFEISFKWNDSGPVTWLELRKPGELSSIRGGQTLAKIYYK